MTLQRPLPSRAWIGLVGCLWSCGGSPDTAGLGSAGAGSEGPADGGGGAAVEAGSSPSAPSPSSLGGGTGTSPGTDTQDAAQDGTAPAPPAPSVYDGAPPPPLFLADSAPVMAASDCKPGTYSGTFSMMVMGLLGGGLTITGKLSITLVANKPTPHSGEFNNGILTVAPGAMFSGSDSFGDIFNADLSGQLDCGSRMFVGTLSNGVALVFGLDAATITLNGSLSATYDPTANPAALVQGSFMFSSPQVAGTTGTGSWSASLQ